MLNFFFFFSLKINWDRKEKDVYLFNKYVRLEHITMYVLGMILCCFSMKQQTY